MDKLDQIHNHAKGNPKPALRDYQIAMLKEIENVSKLTLPRHHSGRAGSGLNMTLKLNMSSKYGHSVKIDPGLLWLDKNNKLRGLHSPLVIFDDPISERHFFWQRNRAAILWSGLILLVCIWQVFLRGLFQ